MAFKLGDVIVDRLQFGYGAKANGTPLYALTQLTEANIDITADSTDINDKDGNLVYRKYTGKKGEVTATNAFLNLAVVEAISATDAEIATEDKGIVMPMIQLVKAGETLDITGYVDGSVVVNSLSPKGSMGKELYTKAPPMLPEYTAEEMTGFPYATFTAHAANSEQSISTGVFTFATIQLTFFNALYDVVLCP